MHRYLTLQVVSGWVVQDLFTKAQSKVYRERSDADAVKVWLNNRWIEGRAS